MCPNEERQLWPQQISIFLPFLPVLRCWLGFFSMTPQIFLSGEEEQRKGVLRTYWEGGKFFKIRIMSRWWSKRSLLREVLGRTVTGIVAAVVLVGGGLCPRSAGRREPGTAGAWPRFLA